MNSTIAQGVLLRLIPALVVFVLAFIAAADTNSRNRWSDLLYQIGMLSPEKKSDPQIQKGVRIPFFVVAACLLFLPITYFFGAARTIQISGDSDLVKSGLNSAHKPAVPSPVSPSRPIANAASGNVGSTIVAAPPGAATNAGSTIIAAPQTIPTTPQ